MEGGLEATLLVDTGRWQVREIGRYPGAFSRIRGMDPVPNVIGFRPRTR